MADQIKKNPEPVKLVVNEKKSCWNSFTTNHPRLKKALGITAGVVLVAGVAMVVWSIKEDDETTALDTQTEIESTPETVLVAEA